MLKVVKKILHLTALSCVLMVGGVERAGAETSQFDQNQGYDRETMNATGGGYQVGAYDLKAIQPTEAGMNWNGKSRFTGVSKLTDEKFLSQWSIQLSLGTRGDYPFSPVIGINGTVYVTDSNYPASVLHAFASNGVKKWEYRADEEYSVIFFSPTIGADGTIYTGFANGVHAVNPDGTRKWVYKTHSISSSPAIGADGTIYVGSKDQSLHAIKPDGTRKYVFATGGNVTYSPAIASDGTILVGSSNGKLYAINPNGTQKWSYNTQSFIREGVTIAADGTIYASSVDRVYAFSQNGDVKWTKAIRIFGSPAVESDGTVYLNGGTLLYALNPDGTDKWRYRYDNGYSHSSPLIGADGTIYTPTGEGLVAVNPTGTRKWRFEIEGSISSPALGADGTLYIAQDHYLHAIGRHHLAPDQDDFSDQQMHVQVDNGTSADIAFDNNYPSDIIDAGTQSGNMLQWQVSTDGINFTSVGITFVDGKPNQARISSLDATKGYQIRTLYKNNQGRQMVYQRVVLRPDKYTGKPLPTAADFITPYGQEPKQPPKFLASSGFSDTQGKNNWYYQEWNGTAYANMQWNSTNNWWQGSNAWTLIGNHWHHADRDTARKFVAPQSGTIKITGKVAKSSTGGGNGVNVKVMKNDTQLWPETGWQHIAFDDATGYNLDITTTVAQGDGIYFIANQDVDDFDAIQGNQVVDDKAKIETTGKKPSTNKRSSMKPPQPPTDGGGDSPEGLYDSVIWDPMITYQP